MSQRVGVLKGCVKLRNLSVNYFLLDGGRDMRVHAAGYNVVAEGEVTWRKVMRRESSRFAVCVVVANVLLAVGLGSSEGRGSGVRARARAGSKMHLYKKFCFSGSAFGAPGC